LGTKRVGDRHGEHQCDRKAGGCQDERRGQHLADQGGDRPVGAHRYTEIASQEAGKRVPQLHDDRFVQALRGDDLGDFFFAEAVLRVAQDAGDRVARQDADDYEGEHIGQQDDDGSLAEPFCGVG
jgi:hypothetical protein